MSTMKTLAAGSQCPPYIPGNIRLYGMRFCQYVQRVRMVLAHKHIKHETVNINLGSKPDWFLSDINPLGMVPVLQMDDKIVYESYILAQYLDEIFPENKLMPADPYTRARDAMLLESFSSKEVTNMYALITSEGKDKHAEDKLLAMVDRFEAELKHRGSPFFGGGKPMMIDFMLWPAYERVFFLPGFLSGFTLPEDRYPNINAWHTRIIDVPAVRECMCQPEELKTFLTSFQSGNINWDAGLED